MDLATPPQLPGLVARRPLGAGAEAPWLARAEDGSWVVVRPGRRPPDLPDHPCLLPVLGLVRDARGRSWVLSPYRSGSGLDRRVARVGAVDPALARICGRAVARALGALHAAGLAHTDVALSRVLLGPRDEVVVDATCARPGTQAAQAADLAALADLLERACATPLGSLAAAVRAARCGVPAAEVADLLAGADRELRRPARHARRRRRSGLLAAGAAALVALALAGWFGGQLATGPRSAGVLDVPVAAAVERPTSPSVRSPAPTESVRTPSPSGSVTTDWAAVLAALDRARGAALAAADEALLAAVDAPGSVAHRRDLKVVRALAREEVVAEGWATTVTSVVARSVGRDQALLAVTDRLSTYVLRDATGEVVERREARGRAGWMIRLVRTEAGWRIADVQRAPLSVR